MDSRERQRQGRQGRQELTGAKQLTGAVVQRGDEAAVQEGREREKGGWRGARQLT